MPPNLNHQTVHDKCAGNMKEVVHPKSEQGSSPLATALTYVLAAIWRAQEFGFPELRAKKALLASGMSVEAAISWIEAHQEDMDIDEPIALVPQVRP